MSLPAALSNHVLQLCIRLRGVSPPIWRRVLIPDTATILDLHNVIQAALGWEDCHLNKFIIRGQLYGVPHDGGISFSTRPDRLQLLEFDFRTHDRFVYEYDFYSRWIHDIRIEKRLTDERRLLPICIAGVGACPPEDSGPAEHFMQQLDQVSIYDTLEWLQETLDDDIPMTYVRDEMIERLGWLERHFNRSEANARLQQLI